MQTEFNQKIILAFQRQADLQNNEHLLTGHIDIVLEKSKQRIGFEDFSFARAVRRFAGIAIEHPEAALFMMRLEQKPKPVAMHLNEAQSKALREDTEAFIQELSPPPQRVVIRKTSTVSVGDAVTFKAGADVLADAFGDEVYIRRRGEMYESPITGRWVSAGEIGAWTLSVNESWASVPTHLLLAEKKDRYFLPRAWNTSGPWISHADLEKKYFEYLKEKACTETQHAPQE